MTPTRSNDWQQEFKPATWDEQSAAYARLDAYLAAKYPKPKAPQPSIFTPMGHDDYFHKGEVHQERESFDEQKLRVERYLRNDRPL